MSMRAWSTALLVALLAAALPARPAEKPVAQVLNASGQVLRKHGDGAAVPVRVPQALLPGDELRTSPGAFADVVFYDSGKRYRVGAASVVRVAPDKLEQVEGPEPESPGVFSQFLEVFRRDRSSRSEQIAGYIERNENAPFDCLVEAAPGGGAVIWWHSRLDRQATGTVIALDGNKVVYRETLPAGATEAAVPPGTLKEAAEYEFDVTLTTSDGARSRTCTTALSPASADLAAALVQVEKAAEESVAKDPDDPVALVFLAQSYEKTGHFTRAAEVWNQVHQKWPKLPGAKQRLDVLTRESSAKP